MDGLVAGNDQEARRAVMDLVASIGFWPIDAGPLVMARVLEGMATLLISLNMGNDWSWQNGWKLVGPSEPRPERRERCLESTSLTRCCKG